MLTTLLAASLSFGTIGPCAVVPCTTIVLPAPSDGRCFTLLHEDGSWSFVLISFDSWTLVGGQDVQALTGLPWVYIHMTGEWEEAYEAPGFAPIEEPLLALQVAEPVNPIYLGDLPKPNAHYTGKEPPCDKTAVDKCTMAYIPK